MITPRILTTFPMIMHKILHDFHPDTGDYALNRTQSRTLLIIHLEGSPHMSRVCRLMDREKGSLTPVVDGLIELGLIERSRNSEDRRKVNLALTVAGRRLVAEHMRLVREHIRRKLAGLSPGEIKRFERAVDDLHQIAVKL